MNYVLKTMIKINRMRIRPTMVMVLPDTDVSF